MTIRNSIRFLLQSLLPFSGLLGVAAAAPKLLPVLNQPIANLSTIPTAPVALDLNTSFGTEAIDDQVVRFTSQFNAGSVPVVLDMALFSNRTPVTRTNFLKYVADGDYVNSFIHRSVPGFVIQGGASRIVSNNIVAVPTDPPIVNEFGVSNTLSTISMAKLGGDPNSATSQWFVSLGENTDILDPQNGGFTVFGRMTRETFPNAQIFGDSYWFPIYNYGGIYTELPLFRSFNQAIDNPTDFLILFPSVALAPLPAGQAGEIATLTYTVVSNSNPTVATASVQSPATLNLVPQAGQSGTTTLVVRATDSVGNTVEDSFTLTVNASDTYSTWASRTAFPGGQSGTGQNPDGDTLTNLQEYAFLGDPAVASQAPVPVLGQTGGAPATQFMTLSFPVRKFTTGLSYLVEANNLLSGTWSPVWSSTAGFSHAQVLSAVDQADRTVVTIKDTAALAAQPQRFMRVKVLQN
ncbi:MAG: peptidylprolyl isomerase [Verrucomicrobia bacterium]|nr:peptidylprolyl isomerase [Verrucomicrobiota bacterium]